MSLICSQATSGLSLLYGKEHCLVLLNSKLNELTFLFLLGSYRLVDQQLLHIRLFLSKFYSFILGLTTLKIFPCHL